MPLDLLLATNALLLHLEAKALMNLHLHYLAERLVLLMAKLGTQAFHWLPIEVQKIQDLENRSVESVEKTYFNYGDIEILRSLLVVLNSKMIALTKWRWMRRVLKKKISKS
ncbi:hypothetical protein [Scytonema sp. NUACC26]|uniref:hypothetical protein n=1 Tax=Scytonema sp. NUACC26 TaxID=3140176 RepID=UPI0038B26DB0